MSKKKAFDCVEFKHQAQARLRAEYEARKHEFSSYGEFINATVKESPWASALVRRWSRKRKQASATAKAHS